MHFDEIAIGMNCSSKKGNGTVIGIDKATRKVYLSDTRDDHCLEVDFNDMLDDPQTHTIKDAFY